MEDLQLKEILMRLLVRSGQKDMAIVAIMLYLTINEQRWQMLLWLRRMMGEEMDKKLEFGEIWLQAEKIKETIPDEA